MNNPYRRLPLYNGRVETVLLSRHDIGIKKEAGESVLGGLIEKACSKNCSDIHGYRLKNGEMDICMRVNGQVMHERRLSKEETDLCLQKIKLESKMDSGISLLPQDGQMQWRVEGHPCHIRVATLPTTAGEDVVLRILARDDSYVSFEELGMQEEAIAEIQTMLQAKAGLLLVTGPTGSGKTSTIYAMLRQLKWQRRGVIVTLEDPVEKELYGIRQSYIHEESGYTYAKGLKAVLRQDPDVIMVGEIRDIDTAQIALQAAYTGHLVISTLHTHDVQSTLLRLKALGCDESLLSYVLRGVVSQQLQPIECECIKRQETKGCGICFETGVKKRELRQELKVF